MSFNYEAVITDIFDEREILKCKKIDARYQIRNSKNKTKSKIRIFQRNKNIDSVIFIMQLTSVVEVLRNYS